MDKTLDVLIIGGGIGGLATALSLHDIGLRPRIFEQAKEIRPLGVGINLLPHSVRELTELGLLKELNATGVEIDELRFYTQYGLEIQREPRGTKARYKWPQFSINRGELQMLLYRAVLERLGPDCIKTAHTAADVTQDNDKVSVSFKDSATGESLTTEPADIVIAADGVHSIIRKKYYPDEGSPIYAGINLWRGTTWQEPFLSGQTMILAGALKTGKMVIYPISQPNEEGKILINWVAEVRTDTYKNNEWNRVGQLKDFAHRYADWKFDWLDVPSMIQNANQVFEYPMVDRDPVNRWNFGRVVLLGDAAHPMYSIGANGAGQAILDARTLAGLLKSMENPLDALKAYEADRLPVTTGVVKANRGDGPDYLLEVVAERAPKPVGDIHSVITQDEIENIGAKYRKITGYDRETLNSRGSLVP
jgi:2-polyprenyl-6-methoxyphenol hydroxylase-like FAD-dependent oxidoreductase